MSLRLEASPTPQVRATSGTLPSSPGEPASPTIISTQLSLSQAVFERRADYTKTRTIRIKVGTWNVANLSGTEKDIGGWFVDGKGVSDPLFRSAIGESNAECIKAGAIEDVDSQEQRRTKKASTIPKNDVGSVPGGEDIGLYVLGLQEIVDVNSVTEALRSDSQSAMKWKQAVARALPEGYQPVAEQQLVGLFLIIFASPSIAPTVSSASTTSVGTGLGGYMGNKGAVTARIVLGETTRMVFVNCHLKAGIEKGSVEGRNWDYAQIQNRTRFDPVYLGSGVMEEFGEGIGNEDFGFWFGDLNYRLDSMAGEDVRRLLMLHTQKLYDAGQTPERKIGSELAEAPPSSSIRSKESVDYSSNDNKILLHSVADRLSESADPASDPTSLQTTLSSLLPHDQLHLQMRTRKAFHDGWREGPINFLPTYKYDAGSVGVFDSSEKRRGPSWCDRILYRTRKDRLEYQRKVQEEEESKRRDEEMRTRMGDGPTTEDESVLFDYDPETDGAQIEYDLDDTSSKHSEVVMTKSGFEDRIHLDYYTSHQRVISSDHKPLDAVFTLQYDVVDPDLKLKIHQEVARELDKAENEGRPVVTVVVDHHHDTEGNVEHKLDFSLFEGVNFGEVRYDREKGRGITIANTGRVPATVGFVDRSVDQGQPGGVAPPWLKINFDRASDNENINSNTLRNYTLQPGDAANVELIIHITDMAQVRRLNEGVEGLEDVLVLRIQNGRDYFLPLRGTWLQSAFGRSLNKLTRIPEGGIRRLQHQHPDGGSHGDNGVKWSAPRELFRLTESIESLMERSVAEWGMKGEQGRPPWEDVGWPFVASAGAGKEKGALKDKIREGLDNDRDLMGLFPPETTPIQKLEAIAETLLAFVRSLEDGIITTEMWTEIEKGMLEREKIRKTLTVEEETTWILELLSSTPAHSISFTFITFMLSRVASEIAPVKPAPETPRTSKESFREAKPRISTQDTSQPRRQDVDGAFAAIFCEALIRLPVMSKEKERKASEMRRKAVLEVFLREKWEDDAL